MTTFVALQSDHQVPRQNEYVSVFQGLYVESAFVALQNEHQQEMTAAAAFIF